MTVNDLFDVIDTEFPSIEIFDLNKNLVFRKLRNDFLGICDVSEYEIYKIYKVDFDEVIIRIFKN